MTDHLGHSETPVDRLGQQITDATLDCMNHLSPEGRAAMAEQLREATAKTPEVRIVEQCLCPPHQIGANLDCPFHGRRR